MGIITGFWDTVKLVCGNHENGEMPEMILESSGSHSYSYVCSKSKHINCNDGENICKNQISHYEVEKVIEHISDMIIKAEDNDEQTLLTHHKWKSKTKKFEIIKHTDKEIIVKYFDELIKT